MYHRMVLDGPIIIQLAFTSVLYSFDLRSSLLDGAFGYTLYPAAEERYVTVCNVAIWTVTLFTA